MVIQITHEKDALIAQTQSTIDSLQTSLTTVTNSKLMLQDRVSSLEEAVTGLEDENCKLREPLGSREEHINLLEGRARHLSGQVELYEG